MYQCCTICRSNGKDVPARYIQRRIPVCERCTVKYENLHCTECGQKCIPVTGDDEVEVLYLSCPCYDDELSMSCSLGDEEMSFDELQSDDDN